MSAAVSLSLNIIASEVRKSSSGNSWSPEVSQKLAKDIEARVEINRFNIREVQEKDNLGRIAQGLSCGIIKSKQEGGSDWEGVQVTYLGESMQIAEQEKENPSHSLASASLVYPGQYVFLENNNHVVVADTIEKIQEFISKMIK